MATDPPVFRLSEFERRSNVPLTHEQAGQLRRHFSGSLDVARAFDGNGYDLAAKGFVGVIVLPDLIIRIDSKVPVHNLFLMLSYAYGLHVPLRPEVTTLDESDSLLEFVAALFVGQVDGLVRQGIVRGYVDRDEEFRYLRGRLQMGEQLRRSTLIVTRFHQTTNEFTADLLENRILRGTLALLLRHYYRKATFQSLLRRSLSAFSEVVPAVVGPADCDRVTYTRLNQQYAPAIQLARLLLQLLSPKSDAGPVPFPAFLLPMHDVFECFVANFLAEALEHNVEWQPIAQRRIFLDYDEREPGHPDLILYHRGTPALVIDTKYKEFSEKPNPADRNQMFAYCHALKVVSGMLLYPNDADTVDHRRLIDGVHLTLRSMSLAGSQADFLSRWDNFASNLIYGQRVDEFDGADWPEN